MKIKFFVATKLDDIPSGVSRFISVDGSILWAAVIYDHHKTGEKINLDAMPQVVDLEGIDGIGTTMMDADAIISAVVAALGGEGNVPEKYRPVLRSAAHWCDYLVADANLPPEANHQGLGMYASMKNRGFKAIKDIAAKYGGDVKQLTNPDISPVFAGFCQELVGVIRSGGYLPCDFEYLDVIKEHEQLLLQLLPDGCPRVRDALGNGRVAIVDLRGLGYIDPVARYRAHCTIQVVVEDFKPGDPGLKYTVGCHPEGSNPDLRPVLADLQAAEAKAWQLLGRPQPEGTWGGRATVFGSPFNYGSLLTVNQVVELVAQVQ